MLTLSTYRACVLGICGLPALAIHASEAGVVDWYKPLIGDTLTGNPHLSPVFHRVGEPDEPTKSYVLSATTSNVLAALHPENGTIGAFGRALSLVHQLTVLPRMHSMEILVR